MGKVSISLTDKLPITKEDHFSRPRSLLGRQSLGDGGLIFPFSFLLALSPVLPFPSYFSRHAFVTFQPIRKGNALTTILPLCYTYYYDYEISCSHFCNRTCHPLRCASSITQPGRVARCVAC